MTQTKESDLVYWARYLTREEALAMSVVQAEEISRTIGRFAK